MIWIQKSFSFLWYWNIDASRRASHHHLSSSCTPSVYCSCSLSINAAHKGATNSNTPHTRIVRHLVNTGLEDSGSRLRCQHQRLSCPWRICTRRGKLSMVPKNSSNSTQKGRQVTGGLFHSPTQNNARIPMTAISSCDWVITWPSFRWCIMILQKETIHSVFRIFFFPFITPNRKLDNSHEQERPDG